jgi:hypothetical protein
MLLLEEVSRPDAGKMELGVEGEPTAAEEEGDGV